MKDRISEFMDGELDDRSAAEVINALGRDGEARTDPQASWRDVQGMAPYVRTVSEQVQEPRK